MNGEPLNIKWKRGEFKTYYALMKIRVGGSTEVSINAGDEFEYDGSVLKYEGREIPQPSLRGSFRQGWVSDEPLDENGSYVPPKQATRNVARSQSVNRDLANVQRTGPRQMASDDLDEDIVLNVSDRSSVRQSNGRGHLTSDNNRRQASVRGMQVNQDEVEAQEAVEIGRIRTSTHFKGDITQSRNAGLKDKLENLSGSGFIRDANGPVMEQQRSTGKIVHREGVTIRTSVGNVDHREGVTIRTSVGNVDRSVQAELDEGGVEVSRVRHSSSNRRVEGVEVRDTSNIRGPQGPTTQSNDRGTNGPTGSNKTAYKVNTNIDPKVRVARAIYPDFPEDWSFKGRLADRMAAVKEYGATPEFLEALYAAEGDQMRAQLVKAYPKQFA